MTSPSSMPQPALDNAIASANAPPAPPVLARLAEAESRIQLLENAIQELNNAASSRLDRLEAMLGI